MSISVEIQDGNAVFQYPPEYEICDREFDDLLDKRDEGRVSDKSYLRKLGELTARYPWFIDAHAHIGLEHLERGKHKLALKSYQYAFKLGETALPADYQGLVEWARHENRPFLRAVGGVIDCLPASGEKQKSIALMEKVLDWNPSDNQGWRWKIGSEYLRAGRLEEARDIFEANVAGFPPYWYELGLFYLLEDNYQTAATFLRRGFVENCYIAEILCGMPKPLLLSMWHGSDLSGPDFAHEYVAEYGMLWGGTAHALVFLRWLHNHPKVLAERAAILECKEELLWEAEPAKRGAILDRETALLDEIDDCLSKEIVIPRVDQRGTEVLPWIYPVAILLERLES